jgi:hypothetical protein
MNAMQERFARRWRDKHEAELADFLCSIFVSFIWKEEAYTARFWVEQDTDTSSMIYVQHDIAQGRHLFWGIDVATLIEDALVCMRELGLSPVVIDGEDGAPRDGGRSAEYHVALAPLLALPEKD